METFVFSIVILVIIEHSNCRRVFSKFSVVGWDTAGISFVYQTTNSSMVILCCRVTSFIFIENSLGVSLGNCVVCANLGLNLVA